jgi:hypothetical protein
MNAEAKQRASGIGASKARAGGAEWVSIRLRRAGGAVSSAAKVGLQQMRAAAALVTPRTAIAPVTLRRVTRLSRYEATTRVDQQAANLWRVSSIERVSSLSRRLSAAIVMPHAAFSRGALLAERGAARRLRMASAGLAMPYRSGAKTLTSAPIGEAGSTRPSPQSVSRVLGVAGSQPDDPRVRGVGASVAVRWRPRLPRMPAETVVRGTRKAAGGGTIVRLAPVERGGAPLSAAARRAPVAPVEAALLPPPRPPRVDAAFAGGGASSVHGVPIGRWVTDYLTEAAMRPPSGVSGLDDRLTPVFAGMVGFG